MPYDQLFKPIKYRALEREDVQEAALIKAKAKSKNPMDSTISNFADKMQQEWFIRPNNYVVAVQEGKVIAVSEREEPSSSENTKRLVYVENSLGAVKKKEVAEQLVMHASIKDGKKLKF